MKIHTALLAAATAALFTASPAFAHAKLVKSTPVANASVSAPKQITLTFNEKIVPTFSKFEIAMVGHEMKVPVETRVSADGKTMTGTPTGRFMKGKYTISWVAAGSDGHRMKGEIPFTVR